MIPLDDRVKALLTRVTDNHAILTPMALVNEILDQVPLSGKILAIANVEWVIALKQRGVDMSLVTFVSPCRVKNGFVAAVSKEISIIEGSLLEWNTDMKFDVVIGNPPYQLGKNRQFYKQFVAKSLTLTSGIVAMITPSGWASFSGESSSFLELLKNNGLYFYKYLGKDTFDIQLLTVYFICDKNAVTDSVRIVAEKNNGIFQRDLLSFIPSNDVHSLTNIKQFEKLARAHGGYTVIKGSLDRNKVIDATESTGIKCVFGCGKKGEDFEWKYISRSHADDKSVLGLGVHKVIVSRITSIGKLGELKYADPSYACSQSVYYIPVNSKEEATAVIEWLTNDAVKVVIKEIKSTVCSNSQAIFSIIPKIHNNKEIDFTKGTIE
jgi:hypothetical protein